MRKHLKVAVSLALFALALGLTPTMARAESVLKGTFELPAEAYWGSTLLQPGQYTIMLDINGPSQVRTIRLSGEGMRATFLATGKPAKESGHSYLEIQDVNGTYVVRELNSGLIGKSYSVPMTKSVHNRALRASASEPLIVPVSTGAGF